MVRKLSIATRAQALASSLLFMLLACGPQPEQSTTPKGRVPENAAEMFQLGELYAERGNYLRAEQYMAAGIQGGYDDPQAIHQLLEVCLEGSFLRSGIEHARSHLNRHADDMEVRLSLAALYYGVGDLDPAREELELVLERSPDNANAHYLAGIVAASSGQSSWPRARAHWEKYLELAPDGPRAIEVELKLREIRPAPKRVAPQSVQAIADAGTEADSEAGTSTAHQP